MKYFFTILIAMLLGAECSAKGDPVCLKLLVAHKDDFPRHDPIAARNYKLLYECALKHPVCIVTDRENDAPVIADAIDDPILHTPPEGQAAAGLIDLAAGQPGKACMIGMLRAGAWHYHGLSEDGKYHLHLAQAKGDARMAPADLPHELIRLANQADWTAGSAKP